MSESSMLTALQTAWDSAITNKHGLYFPPGTYAIGDANFPFKNPVSTSLLECWNITICGDGPATIFKTTSADGADAFQLNALKNIHFRDFCISPVLTGSAGSGSNAISITNGWDNITFRGIYVLNAPSVDAGSFVDGGKALSIQPGTTANECGRLYAQIYAKGCAEGVGFDWDLVTMAPKRSSVIIDLQATDCYQGIKFSAAGASGALSVGMNMGIIVRAILTDCQQDVVLSRAHGIVIDAVVRTSKTAAARRLNPSGVAWRAADTTVEALLSTYAKHAHVRIIGDKGGCDYKAQIGGATAGSSGLSGATEHCRFVLDIGGTATTASIDAVNSGGNYMRSSFLDVSEVTATSIPAILYTASYKNRLLLGGVMTGSFTGTLTGCTTSPTGALDWSLSGDQVTLKVPAITGTSNSTAATITGMPDEIKPAATQELLGCVVDNGVTAAAKIGISTAGVISLYKGPGVGSLSTFTASGTKGTESFTITYRRA